MKVTEKKLRDAQAIINAMMEECNLSRVIFAGEHTQYCKVGFNVGYTFDDLAQLWIERIYEIENERRKVKQLDLLTPPEF